ncbi:unnamed protein product [Withania somnifera]
MDHQSILKKRGRNNSIDQEINSPEVKRLREDLLDDLYDSEYNFCTPSHDDLDSYMKSFEEEITTLPQPELGYLLEASDDELGLPPPTEADNEPIRPNTESVGFSNHDFWGLDEQIPSYDTFDLGIGEVDHYSMGENVGLDELFDHSDTGFGSADFLWRPETLPAQ